MSLHFLRRHWLRCSTGLLLCTLLGGCTLVETFNALIPTGGLKRTADIRYGDLPRRTLDVYQPAGDSRQPRPVVVFFYGGSWDSGKKEEYLFVAEALTSIGVVAVLPDYRLYPEVKFPEFLDDAAAAVRWTQTNIANHGGDPQRIFVMGHSAGAHIAAMLNYDPQWLRKAGSDPRDLAGFIGLAGPYDFLPLKSERLKIIFGPEESRPRSQPINFVTRDAAPALLLHGDTDTIVGPHNSANLARKVRELGGRAELIRYPDVDHRAIVVNLSALFRSGKPELPTIAAFIQRESTARASAVVRHAGNAASDTGAAQAVRATP